MRVINTGKTWKPPSKLARWLITLLSILLLSGCDAIAADRARAEAEKAAAEAAAIRAAYDGRVAETEAETAQILAEQQAAEEDRESRLAAETQRALLRQLELERRAARRANDLALLAIVGAPLVLAGAVAGAIVFLAWRKRREARRVMIYRHVCRLQRRGLLRAISADDIELILNGAVSLDCYLLAPSVALANKSHND